MSITYFKSLLNAVSNCKNEKIMVYGYQIMNGDKRILRRIARDYNKKIIVAKMKDIMLNTDKEILIVE